MQNVQQVWNNINDDTIFLFILDFLIYLVLFLALTPHDVMQEVEVLRKQVDHLAEENGKLLGHQNPKQKIEYLVKLKKEITKLQEVRDK